MRPRTRGKRARHRHVAELRKGQAASVSRGSQQTTASATRSSRDHVVSVGACRSSAAAVRSPRCRATARAREAVAGAPLLAICETRGGPAGASCFQPRGVLTTPARRVAIRAAEQRRRAVTARARNRRRAVVRGGPPVDAAGRPKRQRVCELRRASLPRNSAVWPGGLPHLRCGWCGLAT